MWIQYNPNPVGMGDEEDCSVRALSVAMNISWESAYAMLCYLGFQMGAMPSKKAVLAAALRIGGFYRQAIPDTCPICYTAEDFCRDNPVGTFVLGFGNHVVTVIDGNIYDSWDSSMEIPQVYWYRKEN